MHECISCITQSVKYKLLWEVGVPASPFSYLEVFMKRFKKIIYFMLPLLMCCVLLVPETVRAASAPFVVVSLDKTTPVSFGVELAESSFYQTFGGRLGDDDAPYSGPLYCVVTGTFYDFTYSDTVFYGNIYFSTEPFQLLSYSGDSVDNYNFSLCAPGGFTRCDVAVDLTNSLKRVNNWWEYTAGNNISTAFSISKSNFIGSSHDVCDAFNVMYVDGWYEEPVPENPFSDILDNLQDSLDADEAVQNEALDTEDVTPNVFLRVFQGMTTILRNISQYVADLYNWFTDFVDYFINDLVPNVLQSGFDGIKEAISNLKDALLDAIAGVLPAEFVSIVKEIYNSGLDADGVFGLDTFFKYWLVPDPDMINSCFEENSTENLSVHRVISFTEDFFDDMKSLEPVAPMFTIPAGKYGFITFESDYNITFSWFDKFKPYTDPLIAAFLYIGILWRLFCNIPGLFSGASAAASSSLSLHDRIIRDSHRNGG